MRLYLLPISTRQALLYCQQLSRKTPVPQHQVWIDWATGKVASTWVDWESKTSGWKKLVTNYGNTALKRLPHEEYSLKGIPAREVQSSGHASGVPTGTVRSAPNVEVAYPSKFVGLEQAQQVLQRLAASQKQAYHRKWLIASMLGMPLSAPVALIPIIPNIPFFYLAFRAWSHWRARSGSIHLHHLLQRNLATFTPNATLDAAYHEAFRRRTDSSGKSLRLQHVAPVDQHGNSEAHPDEEMILSQASARIMADRLGIPAITVEIERAVWQVEREIEARRAQSSRTSD